MPPCTLRTSYKSSPILGQKRGQLVVVAVGMVVKEGHASETNKYSRSEATGKREEGEINVTQGGTGVTSPILRSSPRQWKALGEKDLRCI